MPKLFIFGAKKSKHLSDFEAHNIISQIPHEFKKQPKQWEMLRTKNGVIYTTNRKQRTKHAFRIKRLCALLARKHKHNALYDEKKGLVFFDDKSYIIADQIKTKDEYDFHLKRCSWKSPDAEIVSLTKSGLAPYLEMDAKTIREYYKTYKFPKWFKPFLKMRHFRAMDCSSRFVFSSRRYNNTSKWKAEDKFRRDMMKLKEIGKCYYSIARMLDSKKEAEGKGIPVDLIVPVLDVDGKCDGMHEINKQGICTKCMDDAERKLKKVEKRISEYYGFEVLKRLFSGSKGWHIYLRHKKKEISQKELLGLIIKLNSSEDLVDNFCFTKEGVFQWDMHRIFKVPGTIDATTACLISEKIKRIDVQDKICEPLRR